MGGGVPQILGPEFHSDNIPGFAYDRSGLLVADREDPVVWFERFLLQAILQPIGNVP
jgi:hypothetical protein